MVQIKISLNKGIWTCLESFYDENDISILTEVIYDWLEDCVQFVVNPNTIMQIFNEDKQLLSKIKQHISEPKLFSKEQRKEISDKFRSTLRMIEFETITCISHYASKIFPDEDSESKYEFKMMLEKIAIYLLGYNIEYLYENPDNNQAERGIHNVECIVDFFIFFIIVINYDLIEETSNSINKDSLQQVIQPENGSQFIMRKIIE
jgi:hypothetical protein